LGLRKKPCLRRRKSGAKAQFFTFHLTDPALVRQPSPELELSRSAVNRLDARTAIASTASCGGATVRVIGMTGMTTTTPPAGTG